MRYQPNLESLKQHPLPEWYHNAKLGIFIHWGLFSVPAWAPLTGEIAEIAATQGWDTFFRENPYAEWYLNSLRVEGSPTHRHHLKTYGANFLYDEFVPQFNQASEAWNPDAWASLFEQIGARYVVLVTKHHDGFLLWPSRRPHPFKPNYHASRDIVGELAAAVRRRGLRMGCYYSGGLDWSFNPTPITTRNAVYSTIVQTPEFIQYVDDHWHELIDRYQTDLLWNDIGYPLNAPALQLFADYYNTIPTGVINDRFGQVTSMGDPTGPEEVVTNPEGIYYDFTTPEYSGYDHITPYKWESTRGIGYSFGYNQLEGAASYLSADKAVRLFVDIVSKNGNFLLNVGPMADGTIPELQRQCLTGLGDWLRVNGEAVFDTRPWLRPDGQTTTGIPVRYTQKDGAVYAILLDTPPGEQVTITQFPVNAAANVYLLGQPQPLAWRQDGPDLSLQLPHLPAPAGAYAFKITQAAA